MTLRWILAVFGVLLLPLPAGSLQLCVELGLAADCGSCCTIFVSGHGYSDGAACPTPPADPCSFTAGEALCSISRSPTEPLENSGPLLEEASLFLWLLCTGTGYGFGSVILDVTGDAEVMGYEPIVGTGAWNAAGNEFLVNVPCLEEPTLVGRIRLEEPTSVESSSLGEVKADYRRGRIEP